MSFPLTIKYSRRLDKKLSDDEVSLILNYIGKAIEKRSAEDIKIRENSLTFKSSLLGARWNWNIMVPIEKGKFILTNSDNETFLTYEIFMYRLAIIAAIMSLLGSMGTRLVWVGVYFFAVLFGLNWITAVIRHKTMFSDLVIDVKDRLKTNLVSVE